MLKFSELRPVDRIKRYKWTIVYPFSTLFTVLMAFQVSYGWINTLITAFIIGELILFGLKDSRYSYNFNQFFLDSLILILINVLTILSITPYIISVFLSFFMDSSYLFLISMVVSFVVLEIGWYLYTSIETNLTDKETNWKWEITGPFSKDEIKMNGIK